MGKDDPIQFLATLLQGHGERGKYEPFFCEEYHASFCSLLLYRFS